MEWVETTGKTLEEATDMALDRLGVLDTEAEVEVLEAPSQGMFGRVRGKARVRARVRPSAPPPKADRQRKGRRSSAGGSRSDEGDRGEVTERGGSEGGGTHSSEEGTSRGSSGGSGSRAPGSATSGGDSGRGASRSPRSDPDRGARRKRTEGSDREPMPEEEQRRAGEDFLTGLIAAFGLDASVSSSLDPDGILAFEVQGERLGLLMGPGLNTLDAIQEVCRNSIQRQADGREYGKVLLDVSGVRAARTAALEEFVREEARRVLSSGEDVIFEVMSRTDRKVVHDVIAGLDGVETESVGEDPRRRVVLRPA